MINGGRSNKKDKGLANEIEGCTYIRDLMLKSYEAKCWNVPSSIWFRAGITQMATTNEIERCREAETNYNEKAQECSRLFSYQTDKKT